MCNQMTTTATCMITNAMMQKMSTSAMMQKCWLLVSDEVESGKFTASIDW